MRACLAILILAMFTPASFASMHSDCQMDSKSLEILVSDFINESVKYYNASEARFHGPQNSKLLADGCVYIFSLNLVGGDMSRIEKIEVLEDGQILFPGVAVDGSDSDWGTFQD